MDNIKVNIQKIDYQNGDTLVFIIDGEKFDLNVDDYNNILKHIKNAINNDKVNILVSSTDFMKDITILHNDEIGVNDNDHIY